MSVKTKLITASLFSAFVIVGFMAFTHHKKQTQFDASKKFIFKSIFSSKGVGDRIIELKMQADEVKTNDEVSVVTVEARMPFNFDSSLQYKWKLGEGVTLVEGSLNGQLNGLSSTQLTQLKISVKGFSKEINHQVGFEIHGLKNGRKIYGDSIIASDKESTFEDIVQNVEKIKASQ